MQRRSAAFANLGLAVEPDAGGAPLITMLKKKGKRIIENADDIMLALQQAYPWAAFETLEGEAVADMSMKDQVAPRRLQGCSLVAVPSAAWVQELLGQQLPSAARNSTRCLWTDGACCGAASGQQQAQKRGVDHARQLHASAGQFSSRALTPGLCAAACHVADKRADHALRWHGHRADLPAAGRDRYRDELLPAPEQGQHADGGPVLLVRCSPRMSRASTQMEALYYRCAALQAGMAPFGCARCSALGRASVCSQLCSTARLPGMTSLAASALQTATRSLAGSPRAPESSAAGCGRLNRCISCTRAAGTWSTWTWTTLRWSLRTMRGLRTGQAARRSRTIPTMQPRCGRPWCPGGEHWLHGAPLVRPPHASLCTR